MRERTRPHLLLVPLIRVHLCMYIVDAFFLQVQLYLDVPKTVILPKVYSENADCILPKMCPPKTSILPKVYPANVDCVLLKMFPPKTAILPKVYPANVAMP